MTIRNRELSEWQFYDKYSRFDRDLMRREHWPETVDRVVAQLQRLAGDRLPAEDGVWDAIHTAILNRQAMPSMRLTAMAGPAFERDNTTAYNCSYLPIDSIESIVEVLHLAMSGCGVGYSVEEHYVTQLPVPKPQKLDHGSPAARSYVVEDSSEGWADALRHGLQTWFAGGDVVFDYSQVRPAGTVLVTKGGRASGPRPLSRMLRRIRKIILERNGRPLRTIDVHDIVCNIGEAIVQGGVRRTAMISLFSQGDDLMLHAKDDGQLHVYTAFGDQIAIRPWRYMANNSMVLTEPPTREELADLMHTMADGGTGEPGIFARYAAESTMPERRERGHHLFGTNPCGEIFLRPFQFCNLTQAVARHDDDINSLAHKVQIATIIGTIQSMATNFPNLRPIWKKNCEDERLLGVDITGQMDCPLLSQGDPDNRAMIFEHLREVAVETNRIYAAKLGINQSAAVTCVKPSGNSSVLLDSAPGLHPRYANHYIRRVRVTAPGPVYTLMREAGFYLVPDNGQPEDPADVTMWVAEFPIASPPTAVTRDDMTALDQLNHWLMNKKHWTEHNPSVTIYFDQGELPAIIEWLYDHRLALGGLSFLPRVDYTYRLAPYEPISEEVYRHMVRGLPTIDWKRLVELELEDETSAAQELACIAGNCDI